jgi:hypothetical protein
VTWYQPFLVAVALLWLFATERDRAAARIVLIASLASTFLVHAITVHITGAWKLVIPGAVETLTILCLLKWTRNRTGYTQAACLIVAWLAHFLCYVDLRLNTDVVYSHYETILAAVASAQIAGFHDTLRHNLRRLGAWSRTFQSNHMVHLRPASVHHPILRQPGSPEI